MQWIALSNIWTTVACVTLSDGRHVAKLNRTSQAKIRRVLLGKGAALFTARLPTTQATV